LRKELTVHYVTSAGEVRLAQQPNAAAASQTASRKTGRRAQAVQ
jgi:hypothetical protein